MQPVLPRRALARFALCLLLAALPSRAQVQEPAHAFSRAVDGGLLIGALAVDVAGLALYHEMEAWSSPNASPLPWDEPFRGTWSRSADAWSDGLLWTGLAVPALWVAEWGSGRVSGEEIRADFGILGETLLLNYGINLAVRGAQWWSRPMTFASGAPKGERSRAQAHGSFYSGHASSAFAVATAATVVNGSRERPLVPKIPFAVGCYGLATAVSALRVASGKHWPTDVVAGAAVGSAIGWVVPFLHRTDRSAAEETPAKRAAIRFDLVSLHPLVVAARF